MNKIEISLSKRKIFIYVIGSLLFVILAAWIISDTKNIVESRKLFSLTTTRYIIFFWIIRITGIVGVIFFGITIIFWTKKFFDKTPGLIIDDNGITDNSSIVFGLIPWADITDIRSVKIAQSKQLSIIVKNPGTYIDKSKNKLKKLAKNSNLKIFGTPILINANSLNYSFDKLEAILQKEFKKHQKQ